MKLAIFDVDGTLLQNHSLEDECYAAALRHVLGLRALDLDWNTYRGVPMGLPFIGVGCGSRRERLESAGARTILADFNDHATVFDALHSASVPLAAQCT